MKLRTQVAQLLPDAIAALQQLCRQPSISAQGVGMHETVALVTAMCRAAGGRVTALHVGTYPILHVEFDPAPGAPGAHRTLLFYNHYDVQPPEPLEEWTMEPFGAVVRDGKLYARGAADNKGDLVARLWAIRLLQQNGGLPCRVKFLIEGEEETGSYGIVPCMERYGDRFAADACIWEFGDVDEAGRPNIYGGVKGMAYLELTCKGADVDMHSSLGAVVDNAAWRLVHALATLRSPSGEITVPGFMDGVPLPEPAARAQAARIPFDAGATRRLYGLTRPLLNTGEAAQPVQALCFAPTCTICGLTAGYGGPGAKTVLPRQAAAKVDFRLVPGQDPQRVLAQVQRHLLRSGFPDVNVELISAEHAYRTDASHPFVRLVLEAVADVWGQTPIYHPSSAGTGPMYPIGNRLRLPIVSTGSGYAGSRVHAPDENIRIEDFARGIEAAAEIMLRFARA
jgi:acetylornithine deacetylase/succinyl-diaminopimelate desuccinylase-like protein